MKNFISNKISQVKIWLWGRKTKELYRKRAKLRQSTEYSGIFYNSDKETKNKVKESLKAVQEQIDTRNKKIQKEKEKIFARKFL